MDFQNRVWKKIITSLTIVSFVVTFVVGAFILVNFKEVTRILEVGFLIKTQYLHPVSTKQLLQGAVRGMVESLDDPYSVFMDAEEFEQMQRYIQGSIGGIGIYVDYKDKNIVVVSPIEGTPAYKAGILRDDVIIKINDSFTNELNYEEAVNLMRGDPGTKVKISIMRQGVSNLLEFDLTREIIEIPTVTSQVLPDNKDIGYLKIKMFASNSDEAVGEQLQELKEKGIKALILDLRDDPGGDLESAVNIAKYFVPQGPIVYTVDKGGYTQIYDSAQKNDVEKIPLTVLINGGSASASEVLAGAIKDTESGTLIGEKTFGKGIVQAIYPLARGDGLKLTTSKYLTPDKHDIHQKGIEPHILVTLTEKDEEDLQLKKAIEVLEEKIQ